MANRSRSKSKSQSKANTVSGSPSTKDSVKSAKGLKIARVFSDPACSPFDQVTWDKRSVAITDDTGKVVFEQHDIEVPAEWSDLAAKVVASKYFYGEINSTDREKSVKELIHRVARTIADWGASQGYFAGQDDAEVFYNELVYLCLNQYGAFNSPVWFNVGLFHQCGIAGSRGNYFWDDKSKAVKRARNTYEHPQSSACFIQAVDDTMEDIMRLATSEAMLFKFGSGTGTDLSTLRSSREKLAGGGKPSGPLSFMRVYDQVAAVVKSGGKTRRAAKMQSLKIDHPDIKEFITAKTKEEHKAWALIEQGYDPSLNGEAYSSIMFQNSNLSVRLSDEFMEAVLADGDWTTRAVTTGAPVDTYKARELLHLIAEGTSVCGDPGVQYDTTVNLWHTCPNSGRINASNPCSEYMFVDDSACNLASLNLMKFRTEDDGRFDIDRFCHAVRIFIIAQEILVDNASYPTEPICLNSHRFRALGLGYANLGCLVMSLGLPYDSDAGRALAGTLTALMSGQAYAVSAELAQVKGAFEEFALNQSPMLGVIRKHRAALDEIKSDLCQDELLPAARACWDKALALGTRKGFRNAQVTVLAPTGTIGFLMDCDTTGVEPDIALVKYKLLAGGGNLKMVNRTVPMALRVLGYNPAQIRQINDYIAVEETIEGAPHVREEHLPVFDCAFKPAKGKRSIGYMAHLKMMSAVQSFLSGAISKTINMPNEATVDEIMSTYIEGWKLGLKAVAIYRDGSKRSQPLSTNNNNVGSSSDKKQKLEGRGSGRARAEDRALFDGRPRRKRLPATRQSLTHKFDVAGHEGYLTVGLYKNGEPGELFIIMAKEGSTVGGMMDAFGTAISMALQYGVPLKTLIDKFSHQRFEPSGITANREIPFAKSIVDYIFRWLAMEFIPGYRQGHAPQRSGQTTTPSAKTETKTILIPSGPALSDAKPPADSAKSKDSGNGGQGKDKNTPDLLTGKTHAGLALTVPVPPEALQASAGVAVEVPIALADRYQHVSMLQKEHKRFQTDAPACDNCGSITVPNGRCYRCFNCGSSMGCS
ncbi:MAG: vitamin B12-dependent ribonucleotide reductase [Actinobacteria bacterium]|nr:vitamin B12-dependent ribonucleotide reductase [Actinomycetota bacterium]